MRPVHITLVILILFLSSGGAFGQEADSLIRLAKSSLAASQPEQAMQLAEKAYSLASLADDHQGMGEALLVQGKVEQAAGRTSQALRNYFIALREYEWTGLADKQSEVAATIGNIFLDAGLNEKALEYYSKALELGGEKMSATDRHSIRESEAIAYLGLGQLDKAAGLYKELYQRYREIGEFDREISALNQLTYCLNTLQKYEEARQFNEESLKISRSSGDKKGEMSALNNLGYSYKYLGKAETALEFFRQASELGIKTNAPVQEVTVTLTNMAIVSQNLGNDRQSLEYLNEAEKLAEKAGDDDETARIKHLTATTHYILKDYYQAQVYNQEALKLALNGGNTGLAARCYLTASQIAAALYDYETSMQEYLRYLDIRDSVQDTEQSSRQNLSQQQFLVERTEKELDEMIHTRQVERLELNQLRLESEKKEQEVELLKKTTSLQEARIQNEQLEKERTLQELLLAEEKLAAERKDREIKDLKIQQQLQESELRRSQLEQEKQQQEIRVLTQEKLISDLNLQKVRARTRFLAVIVLLALVSLVIIIRSWRFTRRTNKTLAHQRNKIQQQKEALESQYEIIKIEREKSEKLLLNILPEETAAELKEKGYASPQHYDKVTVLFTDFVGFTMVSEKMTPKEIVQELDYCFMAFDKIIDKHNLEKIKTIGDSYMCAGGIPIANDTNPEDVVMAALEIRDFMEKERATRAARGEIYWQLRIGVHTGPVVAGVVGKNKFAYDIWGDAVNTASRMESSGEAGKVNISGFTYDIINDKFECSYRGKIKAKNKGEVDMYFVEGLKPVKK
jgi:class 3 adenylate cyclase